MKALEEKLLQWIGQYVFDMLRISIGLIYLAFGVLKFFPHFSPAEQLAGETISAMTFGLIDQELALFLLALMETTLGLGLIFCIKIKWIIRGLLFHMICTFTPLFLLPQYAFTNEPFSFSIVGQYILKNIVIVSAMLLLYWHHSKKIEQLKIKKAIS